MRRLMTCAVAVVAVLAAGCGDDGGGGGGLTLDEWAEEANATCEEFEARAAEEIAEPTSEEEMLEVMDQAEELRTEQVAELRALGVPDESSEDVERVYELLDEQLAVFPDLNAAIEEGDMARQEEIGTQMDEMTAELDDLATELGVEACVSG